MWNIVEQFQTQRGPGIPRIRIPVSPTSCPRSKVDHLGLSENRAYSQLQPFNGDNDQQNHWVKRGTLFSDTPTWEDYGKLSKCGQVVRNGLTPVELPKTNFRRVKPFQLSAGKVKNSQVCLNHLPVKCSFKTNLCKLL
jgi:hypothetical protein